MHGAPGRTPLQASREDGAQLGWQPVEGGGAAGRAGRRVDKTEAARPGPGPDAALPAPAGAQENLLLSILPAHISMGMKLTIIERLKEHGDRRYMPDNNFHSLYVRRHQNVRWVGGQACACRVSLPSCRAPDHTGPSLGLSVLIWIRLVWGIRLVIKLHRHDCWEERGPF